MPNDDDEQTTFDVSIVNIEENGERWPVPYVLPPGIEQELDNTTTYVRRQNEQSLVLKACGLNDGDSRAAYKTFNNDFRAYKRLKMFVHAEAPEPVDNGTMSIFMRMGSDFEKNYYEYEIPLSYSDESITSGFNSTDNEYKLEVWKEENEFDFPKVVGCFSLPSIFIGL